MRLLVLYICHRCLQRFHLLQWPVTMWCLTPMNAVQSPLHVQTNQVLLALRNNTVYKCSTIPVQTCHKVNLSNNCDCLHVSTRHHGTFLSYGNGWYRKIANCHVTQDSPVKGTPNKYNYTWQKYCAAYQKCLIVWKTGQFPQLFK